MDWLIFFLSDECPKQKNHPRSNSHIRYVKHCKKSQSNKICHRTKKCPLKSIHESACYNQEITRLFQFWNLFPWFPEKNTYPEKYEGYEKWDPRKGSAKSDTSIFHMRDSQPTSENLKIRVWNIDPVFCEDVGEDYKKEENVIFHFLYFVKNYIFTTKLADWGLNYYNRFSSILYTSSFSLFHIATTSIINVSFFIW